MLVCFVDACICSFHVLVNNHVLQQHKMHFFCIKYNFSTQNERADAQNQDCMHTTERIQNHNSNRLGVSLKPILASLEALITTTH